MWRRVRGRQLGVVVRGGGKMSKRELEVTWVGVGLRESRELLEKGGTLSALISSEAFERGSGRGG